MVHRPRLARVAVVVAILMLVGSAAPVAAAKPPGAGGGGGGGGKPGYPDRVTWAGRTWQIKSSTSAVGPGPNVFSKENVRVENGELVLEIVQRSGRWTAAEVIGPHLGYGTYTFTVESDVSGLDPNVVLGMFTWSDRARFNHREIDIEVARWGNADDPTNAQFVVQPHDTPGNLQRYAIADTGRTVHSFTWAPGSVEFASAGSTWSRSGSFVPPSQDEQIRINLWLFRGAAPLDGQPVQIRFSGFEFSPL